MASSSTIKRVILTELVEDHFEEILLTNMMDSTTRVVERALSEPQKRNTVVKVLGYVERVVPRYIPSQFKQHFRMGKETFESLCREVCPNLKSSRTVSGEKKVLATVWLLANQESYRSVADRFGFNKGQLHEIVVSVCHTLVVCDHRMEFVDVHGGNVGSVHDARVWRNSDVKQFLEADDSLSNEFHVIGDSAYPNSNHLLVPFRDNGHLTAIQKNTTYATLGRG